MNTAKKTAQGNGMKAEANYSSRPQGAISPAGRAFEQMPNNTESEVRTFMGGFFERKDRNNSHTGRCDLRRFKPVSLAGLALMVVLTGILAFGWVQAAGAATYYVKAQSSQNVGTYGFTNMTSLTDKSVSSGSSNQYRAYMTTGAPTGTSRYRINMDSSTTKTGQEFFRAFTPKYSVATTIGANATAYADFYMRSYSSYSGTVKARAYLFEYNDTTGFVGSIKGQASFIGNSHTSSRQTMNNVSFGNASWTVAAGNRLLVIFAFDMSNSQPAYLWGQASSSTPSGYQAITVTETTASACTANAPTVSITTPPKTITTSGGSVGYSFTVTNNDTGTGCSGVTYNLSATDSNTTNFNPSTVNAASVSLSPGATSSPIVFIVGGKAGQLTGSDTTTISASATGHTNGSSSVTTTLNVVCTLSAPTLTITPGFQNITSNGGSVPYTLNVQNNDTLVACTNSTTFNLTAMDSNPGSFVLPSTLSQNSVTLAPGANANVTLTVKAISGVTSGANSTSVSSAPSVHDSGSTSNSVSTSIAIGGTCIQNTPLMVIEPSGTVPPGGTATYLVTVTNTDSSACSASTFTPNVVSDSNSVDFITPSTLNPLTLSLGPGETDSVVLSVSAKNTAAQGAVNTTVVGGSLSGHAPLSNGSVSTTVSSALPPTAANLVHNSLTTGSTKWSSDGGWGVAGGKYGQFTCLTCHTKGAPNIKRIKGAITVPDTSKGNIPGSAVAFQTTSIPGSFGDDTTAHASSTKVCEVCHSITSVHKYNQPTVALHETPIGATDCTQCHKHSQGFKPAGGCTICHSVALGSRVAVVGQFSANSHHVQKGSTPIADKDCFQCHWEANEDGSINDLYHGGSANPGAPVKLVIYGAGARPTGIFSEGVNGVSYMASTVAAGGASARTELQKINQVCLGCHSLQNNTTQPFGDGKTPKQYAWDGLSIDERYSQPGTTTWGKYTTFANAAKKNLTKAFSAHGRADLNQRGWDNRPASSGGTGVDGAITNASGGIQVLCFDCHNSHGSSVAGKTTSYTSAATNGGIMKDTIANRGGYTVTYKPVAAGSSADLNQRNAGASLCFDCHLNANAGATADSSTFTTPWGYNSTFGSTQAIMTYWEKPYWAGAAGVNPAGAQMRYPFKNLIGSKGGHFGVFSPLNNTPMGTIDGLCTPCHDPHGVSPTLGTNQAYAVPLLKGTWLTSPYKEDTAPRSTTDIHGTRDEDGRDPAYTHASAATYNIDQNTFGATTTRSSSVGPVISWNFNSTNRVAENADQFGGLCLKCHPKTQIAPTTGTQTSPAPWKSMDRVHNTVKGWGTYGANANNAVHSYTCSKCHGPHNSCLDRLLITNCLDITHRGQVGNGGVAGGAGVRGEKGSGIGEFPGGGGGNGEKRSYAYFFGTTSGSGTRACHDNTNSAGWPDNQRWNVKSPWGTEGTQPPRPTGGTGGGHD